MIRARHGAAISTPCPRQMTSLGISRKGKKRDLEREKRCIITRITVIAGGMHNLLAGLPDARGFNIRTLKSR
jgi:hypothetical protein